MSLAITLILFVAWLALLRYDLEAALILPALLIVPVMVICALVGGGA